MSSEVASPRGTRRMWSRVEAPARGERGRTLSFPDELRPPPHGAGAPIVVIAMERCPEELWERLCRADPTCTFYQTPAWHRIAARHYRTESAPLLFRPGRATVCLPLQRKRVWGVERYFSPFGTYTAPICASKLGQEEIASIVGELARLNLHLVSSPFTQNPIVVGEPTISTVQVIDLESLDPENPMRDWDEGQRRRVRVARRKGVVVRTAETRAEWDRYYELYRLSLERWGGRATVAYPRALFDDIRASLSDQPCVRLWVAEHGGEIGAGYLAFYHNQHVVPWHGAADARFFQLGVTQLLFLAQITDALRRGYSVFDLTGSSGLPGVESFKSRFGTRTVEFASSVQWTGPLGVLARCRDWARARLRRPSSVSRCLGLSLTSALVAIPTWKAGGLI